MRPKDLFFLPQIGAPLRLGEEQAVREAAWALDENELVEVANISLHAHFHDGVQHPLILLGCLYGALADGVPGYVPNLLKLLDKECRSRGIEPLPAEVRAFALRSALTARPKPVRSRGRTKPKIRPVRPLPKAKAKPKPKPKAAAKKPGTAPNAKARPSRVPQLAPAELLEQVQWVPADPPAVKPPAIEVQMEDNALLRRLLHAEVDGLELVRLSRTAVEMGRTGQFDNLLALGQLHGVMSFPHQIETARRVLRDFLGRALLADEVGLGKTVEAGLVAKEYILRGQVRSVLILSPPSLVAQWQEEMASKFGLEFRTPNGDAGNFFDSGDLLLCSIAFARRRERAKQAQARHFDLVIVDEAHHVKNRKTLGFKLVDGLKRRFLLLLSATPVQNQLDELYNLVTLIRPGLLGTSKAFARRFVTRGDPRRPKAREELREILSEVMIRNTRALVDVRLPPRFVRTVRVEPSAAERDFYGKISAYVRDREHSNPGRQRPLLLSLLAQAGSSPAAVLGTLETQLAGGKLGVDDTARARALQQACAAVGHGSKSQKLLEILAEAGSDKTIVFVKYRGTLAALEGLLIAHGHGPAVFHGGLSAAEKEQTIEAFRQDVPVLLSTEIGGEGRNLQFCRRMVNFDLPWNPFAIEQRIGRLHRIGQEREVHVTNLCARETAEDYLLSVLDEKLNMFELVIGELDMILGELEDDLDVSARVFSIWTEAGDDQSRQAGFDKLGDELCAGRRRYAQERDLDEALFGRDFEVA